MRVGLRWLPLVSTLALGCDHQEPVQPPVPPSSTSAPLACKSDLKARDLMPADALIVGYYDMDRERRWAPDIDKADATGPRALMPFVELEALRLGWVSMAAACELPDDFWGSAWFAMDREEGIVAAFSGEGIGNGDNLRCLQGRLARWDEDFRDPTMVVDDGCGVSFEYDGLHAFAPHDDLLVMGTRDAVDRARTAWTYGLPPPPSALVPKPRRDRYMWLAADIAAALSPDELESALTSSCPEEYEDDLAAFVNIRTVELEARLGRRYELRAGGTFGSQADARAAEAVIQALLDAPPPGVPDWGHELIDQLKLDRDDMHVTLELPLSRREAHGLALVPSKTEAEQVPGLLWLTLALAL